MAGSSMKLSSCGVYSKRRFASSPPEYGTPPLTFGVPLGLLFGHEFVEYLPGVGEGDRNGGLGSGLQGGTSTAILEVDGVKVIAIGDDLRVVDLIGASFAKVKRDGGGRHGSG